MVKSVSTPCTIKYAYGYAAVSTLDVIYDYVASPMSVNDLGVVYQYEDDTDRWERQASWWGWSTQEIGNMFPRWHDARLGIGAITQQLINSWGVNYDKAKEEYARFRKSLFIQTADLDEPANFFFAPMVDYRDEVEKQRSTINSLSNSNFSHIGLARRKTPTWWSTGRAETSGTVECVTAPTFMGSHSVKMHTEIGERCYLRQRVVARAPRNTSIAFSLWYMVPIPAGTLQTDVSRLRIAIHILYSNGSAERVEKELKPGTSGVWCRDSLTHTMLTDTYVITCSIEVINDGQNEAMRVYAGAAQLEGGDQVSPWEPAPIDTILFVNEAQIVHSPVDAYIDEGTVETTEEIVSGAPVTYQAQSARSLSFVDSTWRLWYDATPSRCAATALSTTPQATQRIALGWYANPERERYSSSWRITANLLEQYNSEIPEETICLFDIGEFHLDEDETTHVGVYTTGEDPGFSRTLESVCVFKNKLWVLCLETENGTTRRVLKVVNPHSRWPVPEAFDQGLQSLHLECIGDVDVGLATGVATYLGNIDQDPDRFLMVLDGTPYALDLDYDYYLVDFERAQAILRHEYSGELVTV